MYQISTKFGSGSAPHPGLELECGTGGSSVLGKGASGSWWVPDGILGSGFDPLPSTRPARTADGGSRGGAGGLNAVCRTAESAGPGISALCRRPGCLAAEIPGPNPPVWGHVPGRGGGGERHTQEGGGKTSITPNLGFPLAPHPLEPKPRPRGWGDKPAPEPLPAGMGAVASPRWGISGSGAGRSPPRVQPLRRRLFSR